MSDYKQPATSTIGVTHEQEHALIDCRDFIWERGEDVKFQTNIESTVNRDKFGSIKSRDNTPSFTLKAFPITFSPTVEQRSNAGLKEETQVILYTAMLDWNDEGYTLDNLRKINMIKWRITIRGVTYEIKEKSLHSQFADTYLYVTLGLNKV